MFGRRMPPVPSELIAALKEAENAINSGNPENALEILRSTAWDAAAESNHHRARVLALAAEAQIAMGEIEIGARRRHWQRALKNYQKALKLDSNNKDVRRSMNKLISMMDEESISLGKSWQFFDDGNPTPLGVVVIMASMIAFLIAFKYAGEVLERESTNPFVTMEVSYVHPSDPNTRVEGTIIIELYQDAAPKHVESFLSLVDESKYDFTIFHRVIDGFMVQGGDIEMQSGSGGYSGVWYGYCNGQTHDSNNQQYTAETCPLKDWAVPGEHTNGLKHVPGALAAAHSGLNTDGSQFYLVPSDSAPSHLDWNEGKDCAAQGNACHTVYGQVISGQDVVDAISEVATASGDKPTQDVRLISVVRS